MNKLVMSSKSVNYKKDLTDSFYKTIEESKFI